MYLTVLIHGEKSHVKTFDLQGDYYKNLTSEEWEEFMYTSLNIDDCEWITHDELPEMVTVIDTNGDDNE